MPKAWPVEALEANMPLPHAAALILRVKLPETLHYEAGTRRGRVDPVHDMRIGAKRLREAARVLSPAVAARRRKRLLPTVESLNDLLGEVRDRDVLAEAFGALLAQDSRTGVLAEVIADLKRERKRHHHDLVRFLKELHKSDFIGFYEEAMAEMLEASDAEAPALGAFAAVAIRKRLEAVVANMEVVTAPSDITLFHRQRIRVKKLKYALEPFMSILPAAVESVYDQIGELQELMGAGARRGCAERHAPAMAGAARRARPGLEVAGELLAERRRQLAEQACEQARQMEGERFGERLEEALEALEAGLGGSLEAPRRGIIGLV